MVNIFSPAISTLLYWVIIVEKDEKKIETDVDEIEDAESLVLTVYFNQILFFHQSSLLVSGEIKNKHDTWARVAEHVLKDGQCHIILCFFVLFM